MPLSPATFVRSLPLIVSLCAIGQGATALADSAVPEVPTVRLLNVENAVLDQVFPDLDQAWAFEFVGPDQVLVTEIRGQLVRVDLASGTRIEIDGLPAIATDKAQTGLLDLALHPDFADNRRIYFSYVEADASGSYFATVVDTALLLDDRIEQRERLVVAEPYSWSPSNFGGALEFDDRGYLFISMGDRSEPATAQIEHLLHGKILRLNDDGSVPSDNPFIDDPAIDDRIWALGVRNPQGLHFDIDTGRLYEAEHGPEGGDEVNIIVRGANYGWPEVSYGRNYPVDVLPEQAESNPLIAFHLATSPTMEIGTVTERPGTRQPLFYYLPSIAPSQLTVVRGPMFPEWDGDILVAALKSKFVSKLDLAEDHVRSEFEMLRELRDRVRDIEVAEDGSIWILTQTAGLHRLYRTESKKAAPAQADHPGAAVYNAVCKNCHIAGAANAPRMDRPADWESTLALPREEVYRRVLEGYEAMPERGACYRCSDEILKSATDFMLETVREGKAGNGK